MTIRKLSAQLVQAGLVTYRQMHEAATRQSAEGARIGTNLVELGHIDDVTLIRYLAELQGMETLSEGRMRLAERVLELPIDRARSLELVPIEAPSTQKIEALKASRREARLAREAAEAARQIDAGRA